jgi:hypothetical protein
VSYTVWRLRTTGFTPACLAAVHRLAARYRLSVEQHGPPRILVDLYADGGDATDALSDDQAAVPTEPLHRGLARLIRAGQAVVLWSMSRDGHGWLYHEDAQILTHAGVVAGFSIARRANAASTYLERDRIRQRWGGRVLAEAQRHGTIVDLGGFPYDTLDPADRAQAQLAP